MPLAMRLTKMTAQAIARFTATWNAASGRQRPRGFTLIEMMVVVAILGTMAAIAVPNYASAIRRQRVDSALDAVTAFVARARGHAMTSGRCVRVRLQTTNPARLVAEELNSYDCLDSDTDPASAPGRIDGSAPNIGNLWRTAFELGLDERTVEVTFDDDGTPLQPIVTYPHASWDVPAPGPGDAALIYRPTGRLWSDHDSAAAGGDPADIYDDDGVLLVRSFVEPTEKTYVIATSHGPICQRRWGMALVGGAGDYVCP